MGAVSTPGEGLVGLRLAFANRKVGGVQLEKWLHLGETMDAEV